MNAVRLSLFRVIFAGAWAMSLLLLIPNANAAERQVLRGHMVKAVANLHLQPLGEPSSSSNLDLVITLPLRNAETLTNLLQQLYDPTSLQYHHYLTSEQFTEMFGPSEQDYQTVIDFAKANGFTVTGTHSNRTLVAIRSSIANIEKTFQVTLHVYQHPTEVREFYAPDTEPSLDLTVPILHIAGLDNYAVPHPMTKRSTSKNKRSSATPASGSGPSGNYLGFDFRSAYAPNVSLDGSGQVLGLVEFDGYFANDIGSYENRAGLPHVTLQNTLVGGFNGTPSGNADQVQEVSLDIEMAVSMAPGLSELLVYETSNGSSTSVILNQIATDNSAKQISCSWVLGDDPTFDQIYRQFAAQGQSFFQASGDNGAFTSSFPGQEQADSPYVTLVGGTTLSTDGAEGPWQLEVVWNWNVGTGVDAVDGASGGGVSSTYSIPTWQHGVATGANQGSTTMRNVPDVAMVADGIYVISDNGQTATDVGGTSCAAPLWAGFMALVNQQAEADGLPPVGFINPAIYAIGTGTTYSASFHDITTGNNETHFSPFLFSATAGYDLCTGWGTPNGSGLINALTRSACTNEITTSPAPSNGGSTSGGGTVICGSSVIVIATPSPCFNFVNWTESGVPVSTSPNYTFTAVTNSILVANFTPVTSVLINTVSSPPQGGATSGGGTVTCGSGAMVSATASADYSFVDWTENGAEVSTSPDYTFTAASDSTLVANFTCPTSIQPTNADYDGTGGQGTVSVTSASDCAWAATSGAFWIAITSGVSGSASGTVSYTVASNMRPVARTGTMTIGGQTFTINQSPRANCIFALKGQSITLPSKGGSKTVKVEAFGTTCDWIAVSNDPFITITEGATGTGDGTVGYTVPGNTNTVALTGTMTIADQTFTVNQATGGCVFSVSPKNGKFKATGGSKVIKVKAKLSDCAWSAISNDSFITLTGATSGVGSGTVSYSVAANTNSTPLTGTITIADETFTITESGAP
jgi:hypothetical protein